MMKLVKLELVSERDITEYLIGLAESLSDWLFYYTIVATSRRSKLHLAVGNETNSFEWNNRCYGILLNLECIKHISVLIKEHNSYIVILIKKTFFSLLFWICCRQNSNQAFLFIWP